MKLKKVLAGALSGALVLTTVASMASVTSFAEPTDGEYIETYEEAASLKDFGVTKSIIMSNAGLLPAFITDASFYVKGVKENYVPDATEDEDGNEIDEADYTYSAVCQFVLKDANWTWTEVRTAQNIEADPEAPAAEEEEIEYELSMNTACDGDDTINALDVLKAGAKELDLKGKNLKVTDFGIKYTLELPENADTLVDNGDGTYTYVNTKITGQVPSHDLEDGTTVSDIYVDLPVDQIKGDAEGATGIEFDLTANDYITVSAGFSANDEKSTWCSADAGYASYDLGTITQHVLFPEGTDAISSDFVRLQCTWLNNPGCTATFGNVRYTHTKVFSSTDKVMYQKTANTGLGGYTFNFSQNTYTSYMEDSIPFQQSIRAVVQVSEEDLLAANTVTLSTSYPATTAWRYSVTKSTSKLNFGFKTTTVSNEAPVTAAYRAVKANGTVVTAPEGKVFIVTDVMPNIASGKSASVTVTFDDHFGDLSRTCAADSLPTLYCNEDGTTYTK
ncbi:MAG: hypothetical protein ACI4RN_08945 [Oscillospiraceae bacterium]